MIPDLKLCPRGAFRGKRPKLAKKKLLPKFITLLLSLLKAIEVPDDAVNGMTSCSLRRFMPTLVDCAQADYAQRLAVRNWVEAVQDLF